MNNLELQLLLDNLTEKSFLEAILYIKNNESEYKKSDFYKETRMSLATLYEKYLHYIQLTKDIGQEIVEAAQMMDLNLLGERLGDLLVVALNSENLKSLIEEATKNFDLESLMKESEKLEGMVEELKE